jgi:hypothetical protein
MKRYNISFRYSRNGTSWSRSSTFVNADSASDAIAQIKSRYPYVEDIRIIGVR